VVILGAGHLAQAVAATLRLTEHRRHRFWFCARDLAKAQATAVAVEARLGISSSYCQAATLAEPPSCRRGALVINTTPLGMKTGDPAAVDLRKFGRGTAVIECVYRMRDPNQAAEAKPTPIDDEPAWAKTQLRLDAEALGFAHASGLGVLEHAVSGAMSFWRARASQQLSTLGPL